MNGRRHWLTARECRRHSCNTLSLMLAAVGSQRGDATAPRGQARGPSVAALMACRGTGSSYRNLMSGVPSHATGETSTRHAARAAPRRAGRHCGVMAYTTAAPPQLCTPLGAIEHRVRCRSQTHRSTSGGSGRVRRHIAHGGGLALSPTAGRDDTSGESDAGEGAPSEYLTGFFVGWTGLVVGSAVFGFYRTTARLSKPSEGGPVARPPPPPMPAPSQPTTAPPAAAELPPLLRRVPNTNRTLGGLVASALVWGTVWAVGGFGAAVGGVCWYLDVRSVRGTSLKRRVCWRRRCCSLALHY